MVRERTEGGEVNYKDGEKDGLWTKWYENGQMKDEITWKDGELITAVVWRLNGEKCPVTNVVEGNGVLVSYNDDGTEYRHATFKDGEMIVTKSSSD